MAAEARTVNDTLLWYTTRGAGAVTLVLLTGVAVLGLMTALRFETDAWPRFVSAGLHRNLALMSVIFLALHVVTAVVDPYAHLGWASVVIPFASSYRTLWLGLGTVAAELLMALIATSLLRRLLGHRSWRAVHWLAYVSWPVAFAHGLGTGTDSGSDWLLGLDVLCGGAVVVSVVGRLWVGPTDPLARARALFRAATERPAQP